MDLSTLNPQSGDLILFRFPPTFSEAMVVAAVHHIRSECPDNQVIAIPMDSAVDVVTPPWNADNTPHDDSRAKPVIYTGEDGKPAVGWASAGLDRALSDKLGRENVQTVEEAS